MEDNGTSDMPQNLQELEIGDDGHDKPFISDNSPVITINVGGVLFSTHSATLQKVRVLGKNRTLRLPWQPLHRVYRPENVQSTGHPPDYLACDCSMQKVLVLICKARVASAGSWKLSC